MKKLSGNFIIADFMGEPRCKCSDFGWDGFSRSIHYECGLCKKHHMESKFPYDRDLNRIMEVVDKLRIRGYSIDITNSSTKWTAKINDCKHTADTLIEALHATVVTTLERLRVT